MVDLALTLAKCITHSSRYDGLRELSAIIGEEATGKLSEMFSIDGTYQHPRDWLGIAKSIAHLSAHLAQNEMSATTLNRTMPTLRLYETLWPEVFQPANLNGKSVLDFGGGIYAPLAMAMLLYFNGAQRVVSVEPGVIDKDMVKLCSREHMLQVRSSPQIWKLHGDSGPDFVDKFNHVDWSALCSGDFGSMTTLDSPITLVNGKIEQIADSCCGSFDLVLSNSVLEHVFGLDEQMRVLHSLVRPGGILIHVIDLADHRRNLQPYNGLGMLRRGAQDPTLNGLRYCDMKREFLNAGFVIMKEELRRTAVTDDILERLDPKYAGYSLDDLAVVQANVVLRK